MGRSVLANQDLTNWDALHRRRLNELNVRGGFFLGIHQTAEHYVRTADVGRDGQTGFDPI